MTVMTVMTIPSARVETTRPVHAPRAKSGIDKLFESSQAPSRYRYRVVTSETPAKILFDREFRYLQEVTTQTRHCGEQNAISMQVRVEGDPLIQLAAESVVASANALRDAWDSPGDARYDEL